MIRDLLDLGTMSALVNGVSALGCIWTMQAVTSEAGFTSPTKIIKFFHRVAYGLLSIALFANAAETLNYAENPRWVDFVVQCTFLSVVVVSVVRHRMSRSVLIVQEPYGSITKIVEAPARSVVGLVEGDRLPRSVLEGNSKQPHHS